MHGSRVIDQANKFLRDEHRRASQHRQQLLQQQVCAIPTIMHHVLLTVSIPLSLIA